MYTPQRPRPARTIARRAAPLASRLRYRPPSTLPEPPNPRRAPHDELPACAIRVVYDRFPGA